MSNSTVDAAHKKCDVCGLSLDDGRGADIRVLEVPYHAIEDIRKVDEEIADELLENDGRLAYHSDCEHPIHQYLPGTSSEMVLLSGAENDPTDNLVTCPVCSIPVLQSVGRCGRCGKEIDAEV